MVRKIAKFAEKLTHYSVEEKERIIDAVNWAESNHKGQFRASGEPFFIHPLQVAEIIVDMRLDAESVIAALLHDILEDTEVSRNELRQLFGREAVTLVNGVTKISILKAKSKSLQEAETIRKMLFAMVRDIRVILLKLADKLHNMRTLEYLPPEKRKSIATECLEIYAPLADRLGISWVKTELEDLSLKHLHTDIFYQIKEYLAAKKSEREAYLLEIAEILKREAKKEDLIIDVFTRAKHFYSIYQKMKRDDKLLEEIYDLYGIRVLCETPSECYTVLGLAHKLWHPIEGRFKDYIAMPKMNMYQSLHTTVMGSMGKLIEIQIRTLTMHRTAEHGIAAHWIYKIGISNEKIRPKDITIVNRLKNWSSTSTTYQEVLDEIKQELLQDSIYVFTPKGDIVELPTGSTAIDFAYHIHTEVGNRCMGAKADGTIIPLNRELKNTQVIEVLTLNRARPHLNWLRYAKTSTARSKIRHWLNKNDPTLILDKNIVVKKKEAPPPPPHPQPQELAARELITKVVDTSRVVFKVGDETNMMIRLAQCCSPSTGDDIIGYISRGRGIIVHRKSCPNLAHIKDFAERNVVVEWETISPKATRRFTVNARRTSDLFSEIEGAVRKFKGHLIEGKLNEDDKGNLTGSFTMELDNLEDFKKVIKNLRTIPSILNILPINSSEP
ncbi:MAG: bifunctional (p)ppGpp synthetase/guanosine-3',5'-bis(diphosphate) 3'-pyrophosphohydrolase [Spirochaetales bacterium]|nr:MAG: bifunctional (p)ppGpp synthetase/guanosine-3',5'-bis(diphosphate) 3'-pyrophosphohydrolase [Spirochaetales bacterium]